METQHMGHQTVERLHSLDAVRGIALLLGVVLHGTMAFLPELAALGWPIKDVYQTGALSVLFYGIHIFRMATFFIIAGFFAHLIFHRRGFKSFVKDRSKRILLPFALFWIPCIIFVTLIMVWAIIKATGSLDSTQNAQQSAVPLMHFWFLYILTWLYVMILVMRTAVAKLDQRERLRALLDKAVGIVIRSHAGTILLAVPVAVLLFLVPNWGWWGGVPTPDQSLLPVWQTLLIYFYVFCLGWLLHRQRDLLHAIHQRWIVNLTVGVIAASVCFIVGNKVGPILGDHNPAAKALIAGLYGLALTASSFGFIGLGMQFFAKERPAVRYLADASYWVYIWHLPLVFAWQTVFMQLQLHWLIKFPLILILTAAPLLLSYNWFVRSTWIGAMMNGRRYQRGLPQRAPALAMNGA